MPYSLRLLLLLFPLLQPALGWAQANFQPGYILQPAGDTLRGEVDFRTDTYNAKLCRFRSSAQATPREYRPADLAAYGSQRLGHFRSFAVPQPDSTAPQLFLRVLASGSVDLLSTVAPDGTDRYYLRRPGKAELVELRETKSLVKAGQAGTGEVGSYLKTMKLYQGELQAAFQGCPAALAALERTTLSASSLTRAVNRYNTCGNGTTDASVAPALGAGRRSFRMEVAAGASFAGSMKLEGGADIPIYNVRLTEKAHPVVGVMLSLGLGGALPRWRVGAGALYEQRRYAGTSQPGYLATVPYAIRFEASYVRVPLTLRYEILNTGRLRPFVQAGASFNFMLDNQHNEAVRTEDKPGNPARLVLLPTPRSLEMIGALVGVGVALVPANGHEVSLQLRGEMSPGPSNSSTTGSQTRMLLGLVSYSLFK